MQLKFRYTCCFPSLFIYSPHLLYVLVNIARRQINTCKLWPINAHTVSMLLIHLVNFNTFVLELFILIPTLLIPLLFLYSVIKFAKSVVFIFSQCTYERFVGDLLCSSDKHMKCLSTRVYCLWLICLMLWILRLWNILGVLLLCLLKHIFSLEMFLVQSKFQCILLQYINWLWI